MCALWLKEVLLQSLKNGRHCSKAGDKVGQERVWRGIFYGLEVVEKNLCPTFHNGKMGHFEALGLRHVGF